MPWPVPPKRGSTGRDIAGRQAARCQDPRLRQIQIPRAEESAEARKKQKIARDQRDQDAAQHRRSRLRREDAGDQALLRGRRQGQGDLRFRGRELAHQELGWQVLQRVKADVEPISKVESEPRMEGRQMVMVLAPR
jgi:translation initiation factor IF-3